MPVVIRPQTSMAVVAGVQDSPSPVRPVLLTADCRRGQKLCTGNAAVVLIYQDAASAMDMAGGHVGTQPIGTGRILVSRAATMHDSLRRSSSLRRRFIRRAVVAMAIWIRARLCDM